MAGGIELSKASFIVSITSGFVVILVVGLLCGLVARPNNCIDSNNGLTSTSISYPTSTNPNVMTTSFQNGSTASPIGTTTTNPSGSTTTNPSGIATTNPSGTTAPNPSGTTTTNPSGSTTTNLINFSAKLDSLASLIPLSPRGFLPATKVNVTSLENAVIFSLNKHF